METLLSQIILTILNASIVILFMYIKKILQQLNFNKLDQKMELVVSHGGDLKDLVVKTGTILELQKIMSENTYSKTEDSI